MRRKDTNGRYSTISKAVQEYFRALPNQATFHGWELRDSCVAKHPELANAYVDTFLRQLRANYSGSYVVVNSSQSLYKKEQSSTNAEYEKYKNLKQQSFDFGV